MGAKRQVSVQKNLNNLCRCSALKEMGPSDFLPKNVVRKWGERENFTVEQPGQWARPGGQGPYQQ